MACDKPRKSNWTADNIHRLLDHVELHYEKLIGRFSSNLSAKEKKHLWETIARDFPDREVEEVKRKFFNMKAEKVRSFSAYKKRIAATGGGPPPNPPSPLTQRIIKIIGEENPKVNGISGGIDTATSDWQSAAAADIFQRAGSSFTECNDVNETKNKENQREALSKKHFG